MVLSTTTTTIAQTNPFCCRSERYDAHTVHHAIRVSHANTHGMKKKIYEGRSQEFRWCNDTFLQASIDCNRQLGLRMLRYEKIQVALQFSKKKNRNKKFRQVKVVYIIKRKISEKFYENDFMKSIFHQITFQTSTIRYDFSLTKMCAGWYFIVAVVWISNSVFFNTFIYLIRVITFYRELCRNIMFWNLYERKTRPKSSLRIESDRATLNQSRDTCALLPTRVRILSPSRKSLRLGIPFPPKGCADDTVWFIYETTQTDYISFFSYNRENRCYQNLECLENERLR